MTTPNIRLLPPAKSQSARSAKRELPRTPTDHSRLGLFPKSWAGRFRTGNTVIVSVFGGNHLRRVSAEEAPVGVTRAMRSSSLETDAPTSSDDDTRNATAKAACIYAGRLLIAGAWLSITLFISFILTHPHLHSIQSSLS
jgi:hypothetical protein